MIKRGIFAIILLLLLVGCSVAKHTDKLGVLASLGKSEEELDNYIERQVKGLEALKKAIKNGELKTGMQKGAVVSRYGEPVLYLDIQDDEVVKEKLLYRHPKQYFSEDRVYLYFDKDDRLVRWE